jgi:SAM-dependent methyltransferase
MCIVGFTTRRYPKFTVAGLFPNIAILGLFMASAFQVESIRRLLSAENGISTVYAPGLNRPVWNLLLELNSHGSALAILSKAPGAAAIRDIAPGVPGITIQEIPSGLDLLVADDSPNQSHILREVLATGARPRLIVSSDLNESGDVRRAKYCLLTESSYYYAGLCGAYSLWTILKRHAGIDRNVLTALPPEIASLPLKSAGVALLDREMAPAGEVLQLPARAGLRILGWAIIGQDVQAATHVFACVRHESTGVEEYMRLLPEQRPDVSAHFGNERLLMTGFRTNLSVLCRRTGVHQVTILQSDGVFRYESNPLFRFELQYQEYELAARVGLGYRYLYGSGIEIGALQKPLKLSEGCEVRYIDRMTVGKLLEHYPEMTEYPVQAPDIVDDGQQLAHIAEDSQDFIIANHFLEHCPDPIRSIHNMLRVVRQGGILYLAVPDKRQTFDLRRPATPYVALKNAYLSGQRTGTAELFHEWARLGMGLPPEEAKKLAEELIQDDYSIHYNVWATTDLLSFLLAARQDFHIPFELIAAVSSENETIVLLERTAGRLPI